MSPSPLTNTRLCQCGSHTSSSPSTHLILLPPFTRGDLHLLAFILAEPRNPAVWGGVERRPLLSRALDAAWVTHPQATRTHGVGAAVHCAEKGSANRDLYHRHSSCKSEEWSSFSSSSSSRVFMLHYPQDNNTREAVRGKSSAQ